MESIDSEPENKNLATNSVTTNIKRPFESLNRRLEISELKQSGTQKLLLAENDRLDLENFKLKEIQEKFHEKDKECDVLKAKSISSLKFEIIHSIFMPLGGIMIGFCKLLLENKDTQVYGVVALVLGILFISIPSFLKWRNI